MKKLFILPLLLVLFISGCSDSSTSSGELTEDEMADSLVEGAFAYVTYKLSGMGTTKENLDTFVMYAQNDDRVREMLFNGDIIAVEQGTEVKILKRNLLQGWVQVQIESGKYQGVIAYALYEHIGSEPN